MVREIKADRAPSTGAPTLDNLAVPPPRLPSMRSPTLDDLAVPPPRMPSMRGRPQQPTPTPQPPAPQPPAPQPPRQQRRRRERRQQEGFEQDELFEQFKAEKYQGGRSMHEHPDPVQRRRRRNYQEPRVRFNTAMNYETFRRQVAREFEQWKRDQRDQQSNQPRAEVGTSIDDINQLREGDYIQNSHLRSNGQVRKVVGIKGDALLTQLLSAHTGRVIRESERVPGEQVRREGRFSHYTQYARVGDPVEENARREEERRERERRDQERRERERRDRERQEREDRRRERPHVSVGDPIEHPRALRVGDVFRNRHLQGEGQHRKVVAITDEGRVLTRLVKRDGSLSSAGTLDFTLEHINRHGPYKRFLTEGQRVTRPQDAPIGGFLQKGDQLYKIVHRTPTRIHLQDVYEGRGVGRARLVGKSEFENGDYKIAPAPSVGAMGTRVDFASIQKGDVYKATYHRNPKWVRVEQVGPQGLKIQEVNPETGESTGEVTDLSRLEVDRWARLARMPALPRALRSPVRETEGGFSEVGEGDLVTNIQPNRYEHIRVTIDEEARENLRRLLGDSLSEGEDPVHAFMDLAGAGGLAKSLKSMRIRSERNSNTVTMYGEGDYINYFDRNIHFKGSGQPDYIYNAHFALNSGAPPKAGIKVFASQVAAAKKYGFSVIETTPAGRAPFRPKTDYIGYYVWPRFGYDAPFDERWWDRMPDDVHDDIRSIRPSAPRGLRFLDVMSASKRARDWWRDNGVDGMGTMSFDLSEGSRNLKFLERYVREISKDFDMSTEEFLQRAASKKKKKKVTDGKRVEEAPRWSPEDEEIAGKIWDEIGDEIRQENKKRKKEAAFNLLHFARQDRSFRRLLLAELRSARFERDPAFQQYVSGRRFPNPNPEGRLKDVAYGTLPAEHQQKIYEEWKAKQQGSEQDAAGAAQKAHQQALQSKTLTPNRDPARYEGVDVTYGRYYEEPEEAKKAIYELAGDAARRAGMTPEQYLTDLAGGGGVSGMLREVTIYAEGNRIKFSGYGDHIEDMDREISFEDGKPAWVKNEQLVLEEDAPPGTGTRMLATQVASLKEAGAKGIKTLGAGCFDCGMAGYYVWPRLGFDGEIPENEVSQMPREIREELIDMGGGEPFYLSEVMSFPEGRDWWRENGAELDLEFNVNDDEVLQKYVSEKSKGGGKTVGQFLHNASKKKPKGKKSEKGEHEPRLDEEDNRILDEIWDEIGKKRKGKKMKNKTATRALLELAKNDPAFRKAFFGEIKREANINLNIRDFALDEFSQHQMLRNLREGDLIEITYRPEEGEPRRIATRLVDSDFEPTIPGVLLRGASEGNEMLVDRGQGMPLMWEPGEGYPALPVLKLQIVYSKLG